MTVSMMILIGIFQLIKKIHYTYYNYLYSKKMISVICKPEQNIWIVELSYL